MRHGERGFTYVWALACVAVMGIGLSTVGPMWADAARREREHELLRIGTLYAHAIEAYRQASPGSIKQFPASLDELLFDARYLGVRRHLRELYTDPMVPGQPFALLRDEDGRIRGVYSTSREVPLGFGAGPEEFNWRVPASSYADWTFTAKEKP